MCLGEGTCTCISLFYCSKYIVDTRFMILCQVAKCVLKVLFLLLFVVLTIGHLSVVDKKHEEYVGSVYLMKLSCLQLELSSCTSVKAFPD